MMQTPSNNLFKSGGEIFAADSKSRTLERWLSAASAHSAELIGMALFATIISLVFTPFRFGTSNNIFHIPYVLNLAARPEFANDQFYQSLQYFTSVVWPVMRLFATETNVYWLFFAAQVISRASAFVALAFMLVALGVRSRGVILLGLVIAAVSPWLRGASLVGQHGMFVNSFNHSEFTWPFLIAALLCTLRRRYIWAAVLAAVTVSINAFVGFWLLLMMAACVLCCKPRPTIAVCAKASLVFVMLTLPIALWIKLALAAPASGADVSFTEYVRLYYPYHFLIEAAPPATIKNLLFIGIAGIAASRWIANGHFWRVAVAAAAAIFLAGTVLPYLFDLRMIFNLHLLRVDGVLQLLCIVMVIAASLIKLSQANGARGTLAWCMILVAVSFQQQKGVPALVLALMFCHAACGPLAARLGPVNYDYRRETYEGGLALLLWLAWVLFFCITGQNRAISSIFLAAATLGFGFVFFRADRRIRQRHVALLLSLLIIAGIGTMGLTKVMGRLNAPGGHEQADPLALAGWLRVHPIPGPLLLAYPAQDETFQLRSRTSVWVDWKQGAAVMWYPPFYQQWAPRYKEVRELTTLQQLLDYAKAHDLRHFIGLEEAGGCPDGSSLMKAEGGFVLCAVK